jgi:hypothetical protein
VIPRLLILAAAGLCAASITVVAQRPDAFQESANHPAILYSTAPATDAVAQLDRQLASRQLTLTRDASNGYLKSVLDALQIPVESQMLVFSQTSKQAEQISFLNPRAVYFNDHVAVGWVRGADVLEIAAQDPKQGAVFYTLQQKAGAPVRFTREISECLQCHLTWDTLAVPGFTAISTYPLPDDKNAYANGFTTDHRSLLSERWGGWFVTGQHGQSRHMGNVPVMPADKGKSKIARPQAVLPSVQGQFDLSGYLTPYSDVVALLVFDHQLHLMNLITRVGWEARVATATGRPPVRVGEAARDLVDYMLFGDEAPLPGAVQGMAGFAAKFSAAGPRDGQGRSLRDFDLQQRMFKYPCSYMIYSDAFDALPALAKDVVYQRLFAVLSGKETSPALKRLTPADRRAILEILRATKKGLPAYFAS